MGNINTGPVPVRGAPAGSVPGPHRQGGVARERPEPGLNKIIVHQSKKSNIIFFMPVVHSPLSLSMEDYKEELARILNLLRTHPRGLTITEISRTIGINRNSVAKYLDVLFTSGHIEAKSVGPAKVYFLSHRVPLSAMLNLSSDLILVLDDRHRILYVNDRFLEFEGCSRPEVLGQDARDLGFQLLSDPGILSNLAALPGGEEVSRDLAVLKGDRAHHFRVGLTPSTFEDGSSGITFRAEDRTDETHYRKTLEISEARYRAVVEDQTEMICRFLPDGTHVFVNDAYCRYFGRKREDLIGHRFIPRIPEEDGPKVAAHLSSLTREQPVGALEHRIIMPGGDVRWQRWIDRVILDDQGRIVEYQSVGRDTTDRKRAEEQLRHQTLQLQERVKELRCLLDISRLIESADEDLPEILPSMAQLLPTAMQFPDKAVARIVLDGKEYTSGPLTPTPWRTRREIHIHGDTAGTVELYYTAHPPVPDAEVFLSEETALVGAVAERLGRIAERLGAEAALQEQIHLVNELLDRIPVPVFFKDCRRVYLGCNRAFEQFSRLSRNQIIGHTVSEVWPAQFAARYDAIERQVLSSGGTHRDEMDYPVEGGAARSLIFNRVPFYGTDGAIKGLVATIIEVTDQKRAEQALRASEEQFREMAQTSPFPIALIDGGGRYRYLNRKFTDVFGYTLDDVPDGHRWFETAFPDPDLRTQAVTAWKDDLSAAPPGVVRPRQFPVRCRNGECREIIFRPMTLRDGSQYITYEDVTERLHAMESLRKSETRYKHLFNTMRCCFTLVQPVLDARGIPVDLTFLEVNAALERLTGRTQQDLLGRNFRELYPGTPAELIDAVGAVALTGDPKKIVIYHPDFQKNLKVRAYSPWKGQCAIIFRAVSPEGNPAGTGRDVVSRPGD